ncbi:MAG: PadR family transcriptional regulator [Cyclobacteriaceae bacterium]
MKGTQIGEFEELVLLIVAILNEGAYGVAIRNELEIQSGRKISIGAVHATTNRLEDKGFLESKFGEVTLQRGGKRKKLYTVSSLGQRSMQESKDLRNRLWELIPQSSLFPKLSSK